MMNLKDSKTRQKFLQDNVNRKRLINQLEKAMNEAERNALPSEAKVIAEMIEYLEKGVEMKHRKSWKNYRLRKSKLI